LTQLFRTFFGLLAEAGFCAQLVVHLNSLACAKSTGPVHYLIDLRWQNQAVNIFNIFILADRFTRLARSGGKNVPHLCAIVPENVFRFRGWIEIFWRRERGCS
jgi:hypothetical protein